MQPLVRLEQEFLVYIDNSGDPTNAQSWDKHMKDFPIEFGGQREPKVGAGKVLYRDGFDHAPTGIEEAGAEEGDLLVVNVSSGLGTDLSDPWFQDFLSHCTNH